MQQTFQCINCNSEYRIGQQFCTFCGQKILYQCPQCHNEITPESRFCPTCAAAFNWGFSQNTESPNYLPIETAYPPPFKQEFVKPIEIGNIQNKSSRKSVLPWIIGLVITIIIIVILFAVDMFYK